MNHQELVHARFGKKRGALAGAVKSISHDHVELETMTPVRAGDGVVFDTGGDTDKEQGGRVWEVRGDALYFERDHIDFTKLKIGDHVWKTSDPKLERELRKTFAGEIAKPKTKLDLTVTGGTATG